MVETHQMVAFGCFAQRALQQLQLVVGQVAGHGAGDRGVEHDDAPGAKVDYWLQQLAALAGSLHGGDFVMVAGQPAGWCVDG